MAATDPSVPEVAPGAATPAAKPAELPDASGIWPNARFLHRSLRQSGPGTFRYLFRTDTHTYAFSVAANAVLSFLPFMVMLLTITRRLDHFLVKHYHVQHISLRDIVMDLLRDYLPVAQRTLDTFIVPNIDRLARARQGVQIVSVLMLLISSTGIFLPLEVALNRIWGFGSNRSYLRNQLVALGLSCSCAVLALIAVGLTASGQRVLQGILPTESLIYDIAAFLVRRIIAILASFATFFLIYWILPNGKVPIRAVARTAIAIGLIWEASKYLFILCLPLLDFEAVYGPFSISVTLIFWSFLSGLLLLSGAHLSRANVEPR